MDIIAIILIALGALVGAFMATKAIKGRHVPKGLAVLHGVAVSLGVILLFIHAFTTAGPHKHWDSIIIFIVAATGGIYVLHKDVTHQRFPTGAMILHGLIGLGGLVWLFIHLTS